MIICYDNQIINIDTLQIIRINEEFDSTQVIAYFNDGKQIVLKLFNTQLSTSERLKRAKLYIKDIYQKIEELAWVLNKYL